MNERGLRAKAERNSMTHDYVFKRSIQIDPNFAYAYTLSGHEYVANDDLDKALLSFRTAIRVDSRHYNAWCVPI